MSVWQTGGIRTVWCIDHHIGRGADLSTIVNVRPLAILEAEEQIID